VSRQAASRLMSERNLALHLGWHAQACLSVLGVPPGWSVS